MLPDKCFILTLVMFSLKYGILGWSSTLPTTVTAVSTAMLVLVESSKIGRRCRISAFARKGSGCGKAMKQTPHDKEVVHSNPAGLGLFLFSILSVAHPLSGPSCSCHTFNFPINKCLAVKLEANNKLN